MAVTGKRLESKVAIVTGGASGIGLATAKRFSEEGATVIIADLRQEAADKAAGSVAKCGGAAIGVKCDISIESEIKALVNQVQGQYKRIDILANVAGVWITRRNIEEVSLADLNRILAVNVCGTFMLIREAIPFMKKQRYGRIVNVSSVAGVQSRAGTSAYAASKGAIVSLTRELLLEAAPFNITVNAVAPGVIRTPMAELVGEARLAQKARAIPLGRLGFPEELASVIAFLSSDDASYMTGQLLVVDGGMTSADMMSDAV